MTADELFSRTERYNGIVDVTPALAEDLLNRCNTRNRKLVDSHVELLADEMRAGRWRLTHQGIAFSPNRMLLDGQHRLWAVAMSGKTVPMRVFVNEPADTMTVVDAGKARSNDQLITLGGSIGHVGRNDLATLRTMITGLGRAKRRSAGEEQGLLAIHRAPIAFAEALFGGRRPFRGVATAVTKAVLARAWYAAESEELRRFADVLQTGVPRGEGDHPAVLLFQFLVASAGGRSGQSDTRERYAKTERALSAFLRREQLGRLCAASQEMFPLPEEV
jgi:hypothetical protein